MLFYLLSKSHGLNRCGRAKKNAPPTSRKSILPIANSKLLNPNLSVRFPGLNLAPSSLVAKGCQDVIGSIPSVFLDKKFVKELRQR